MLKAAYFTIIAALIATAPHLVAGNSFTRVLVLALYAVAVLFIIIGFYAGLERGQAIPLA